jgi:REP element-mobilizing transposase RayT
MVADHPLDIVRKRRSVRLRWWNYARPGTYSVTICVRDRDHAFGCVEDGRMRLNDAGRTARRCWMAIPEHHPRVLLDTFVIMPNHMHGILRLKGPATTSHPSGRGSLAVVVGTFKAAVTRTLRREGLAEFRWQRGYHEHIVRSQRALHHLRWYIRTNPRRW